MPRPSVPDDRFELVQPLGAGGLGEVWEATDRVTGGRVAIKALSHASPDAIASFQREFRAMAEVRHPNFVRLDELFRHGDAWLYTMEVVDGVDLLTWVCPYAQPGGVADHTFSASSMEFDEGDVLPPAPRLDRARGHDEVRLRESLAQLAQALHALHDEGLVHRDVKPSNVLVTPEGRVVLLDFGLVVDETLEALAPRPAYGVAGTLEYMAPEQSRPGAVGPSADWYAVGVFLHRVLSGRSPFEGAALDSPGARRRVTAPRLADRGVHTPADLVALCDRLLEDDPALRPTGDEVLAALGTSRLPATERAHAPRRGADAPTLFGRDAAREALLASAARVRSGSAEAWVISGPAGIGRTALVRAVLQELAAEDTDAVAFIGRCHERETVAYNGFDTAVDALAHHLREHAGHGEALSQDARGALVRLFPALGRVRGFGGEAVQGDPSELRARAFDALRELLDHVASDRLTVLFLDDLQWASPATLLLWSALASRAHRLLLVATVRDDGSVEAAQRVASLAEGRVRRLALAPLGDDDSREVVDATLADRAAFPSAAREAIVRAARGHPLLLREAARSLADDPDQTLPWRSLGDLLRRRVGALGLEHRRVLDIVVVAGAPIEVPLLVSALDATLRDVRRWLDDLATARVINQERAAGVRRVSPLHEALRASVLDALDTPTTTALHHRLADAYLASPAGSDRPLLLLSHLEGAGRHAEAASHALSAAAQASHALAFEDAARLYERALALGTTTGAARQTIATKLAEARLDAGQCHAAGEEFLALAREEADTLPRRAHLRRAAECFLIYGELDRALPVFDAVLRADGVPLQRSPWRLMVTTAWHQLWLRVQGIRLRPRDPTTVPPRELARLDALATASRQLGFLDPLLGFAFRIRALRAAVRLGHPRALVEGIALEGVACAARGGRWRDRAEEHVATARLLATLDADRAVLAGCVATMSLFGGDFARAVGEFEHAEDGLRRHATGSQRAAGLNHVRVWKLKALAEVGDLSLLREQLDATMDAATAQGDRLAAAAACRVGALRWLAADDVDGLRATMARLAPHAVLASYSMTHHHDLRARVEVALYQRAHTDTCVPLRQEIARLSRSLFGRSFQLARVELRVLAARLALAQGDARSVSEAATIARRLRREAAFPLAELWADALDGCCAVQRGDMDSAKRHLDRVATEASRAGLTLLATSAKARSDQLGGQAPSWVWFEAHGVVRPDTLVDVLLPGSRR